MSKPYKYDPETETVSDSESTMRVMEEMPEWEGKDLIEDIDFETDLHPDNHNIGIAIPIIEKSNRIPDRDIIKMKYNYEFVEMLDHYMLVLNEEPKSIYPKKKYSKQQAEDEAADEVEQACKRHGRMNINYDGVFLAPKANTL